MGRGGSREPGEAWGKGRGHFTAGQWGHPEVRGGPKCRQAALMPKGSGGRGWGRGPAAPGAMGGYGIEMPQGEGTGKGLGP